MFKKLIAGLFTVAASAAPALGAQWTTYYSSHDNQLLNQERGTYMMGVYMSSNWRSIGASTINQWKQQYHNTLVLAEIVLDSFKWSNTINQQTFNNMAAEFQLYRNTGVKCILRFVYTVTQGASAPWGDAGSPSIVFAHIQQMTPFLKANQDVIAYAQTGFVGIWGEWYYTDAFGDAGRISAQNMADRKRVHTLLLAALPDRTVQLRTPGFMTNFFGTTPAYGLGSSELHRTGNHNDCFLADSSDMGTYLNYRTEYPYLQQQTQYSGSIFETCQVSTRSACPTALQEIAGLHMVSGHRGYNANVWNQWSQGGCYDTIMRNMGHRFALTSSSSDVSTTVGSSFSVSVSIANKGVAAPVNQRKTEIILRKVDDGSICVATLPVDARTMAGGTTFTLAHKIRLPWNIAQGRWELLLQFADPYSTMYGVPWYKIQAANNNIYESGTGMHKLNAILDVVGGSANSPSSGEVNAVCGYQLSNIVNATVGTADWSCMGGYYMVNGVCTMCPAGSYCSSATSAPVACSAGTWSAGGQRTCTACTSCNGKGTCQAKTGACLCNAGSSGFDCSLQTSTPVQPTVTPVNPGDGVVPVVTTGCSGAVNLLKNPDLTPSGSNIPQWVAGGTGYTPAIGLKGRPSAQLYIPVGTSGMKSISQTLKFTTPTSNVISFGAYVSSYLISGWQDNNFGLRLLVTYTDGTTANSVLQGPVPSASWVWKGNTFTPAKPVAAVTLEFLLQSHTGNSYITEPVVALAPACSIAGGPVGVAGGIMLDSDESGLQMGLSQSVWIGIYAACGAVALLIAGGVAAYCYKKKKQNAAVENAVSAQLTQV